MDVVSGNTLLPGDPRLIDHIVCELKSQGIFDQFRKECIADVDTKPAYQNLRQRVEGSVTGFLKTQCWRPDMNKNQLREALRKNIYESGFLETGVERIVDQVVNPKINTVFLPQVEDVVYKFLGLEKPIRNTFSTNGPLTINTIDLLPTDLDPISPDSEVLDKTLNKSNETANLDDSKLDDFESPPFEPITDQNVYMQIDESSNDSKISGISGLTSHDSNASEKDAKIGPDITNPDSQLSKVSSNSRLSIITNESTKHMSEKMDISEESSNSIVFDHKISQSFIFEQKNSENGFFNIQQEIKDELEAIRMEINGHSKQKEETTKDTDEVIEKNQENEEILDISKENEEKLTIEKEETKEVLEEKIDEQPKQEEKIDEQPKQEEKIDEQPKQEENLEEKQIDETDPQKTEEKKDSKTDRHRHDSDRKSKDKRPDKKYTSSSKSSSSSSSKDKDKHKDKNKDSKPKETSSKSKEDKDTLKKTDRKSSSSSKHSSRDRSRTDSNSKSSKDQSSSKKDSRKISDKTDETKSRKSDAKTKPDEKSTSSRSREHSRSDSSSKNSRSKKSSTSQDKKDSKDSKKSSKKDDHNSSKDKKDNRRSADRDSNDGSSGVGHNTSGITKDTNSSSTSSKSKNTDSSDSNSGTNDSGQSDSQSCQPQDQIPLNAQNQKSPKVVDLKTEDVFNQNEINYDTMKIQKPKIASNIFEARKLMKIRKKLEKLEKRRQKKLVMAQGIPNLDSFEIDSVEDTDSMDSGQLHIVENEELETKIDSGLPINEKLIYDQVQLNRLSNVETDNNPKEEQKKNNSVISKESWDAIEAKLNQSVNQNVDFDSYIDENNDSSSSLKIEDNPRRSKRFSDDEDCLYFNNQISPTTERFLKSVETFQKSSTINPEEIKMAPPSQNTDKPTKRPRKSNLKNNLHIDPEIVVGKTNESKTGTKRKQLKGKKRKIDGDSEEIYSENNNKRLNNSYNVVEIAEEYDEIHSSPSASNASNGSIEISITKKTNVRNKKKKTNSVHNETFPLPLSPESDKSGNTVEIKSKMADDAPPARNRRASTLKHQTRSQRYSSDDLYKPRPFVSGSRRQRGMLNSTDKK